jgi:hypothetical protein
MGGSAESSKEARDSWRSVWSWESRERKEEKSGIQRSNEICLRNRPR